MISEIQNKIKEIKHQKNICILAHLYQNREIAEVADFVGDSFELAEFGRSAEYENILLCGTKYMAENVKIFSPEKHIYTLGILELYSSKEQITSEMIVQMKVVEPERTIVAHIDTPLEIKAVSDICVTTSNAIDIIKNIPNDKILFIPDGNLGDYIKRSLPEKDIRFVHGSCSVYSDVNIDDVNRAKGLYPNALLLVNPKCSPEVVKQADYVGSETGIINFAKQAESAEFIIGTEISIKEILQYECPEKRFYLLSKNLISHDMKIITLNDVLDTLYDIENGTGKEINVTYSVSQYIEKMFRAISET